MKTSGSAVFFLILYVDDILIMGNDISVLQSVKIFLSKKFSMKDLERQLISWGSGSIEIDLESCLVFRSQHT